MVLLLGSRGRSRSRSKSGLFSSISRIVNGLLGRSSNASSVLLRRGGRSSAMTGLVALGLALACFAGGYMTGSYFTGSRFGGKAPDGEPLKIENGPRTPTMVDVDARAINSDAFVVSAYQGLSAAEAKAKAKALSDYLLTKGLKKARPYEWPNEAGPFWIVAVYFDGPSERDATRSLLRALPADVPDAVFASLRKSGGEDWPKAWAIR